MRFIDENKMSVKAFAAVDLGLVRGRFRDKQEEHLEGVLAGVNKRNKM